VSKHSLDLFLQACGAAGPLQLNIEFPGTQETESRLLAQPFALLGRHPHADLCLDHGQISQRHAYVQVLAGRAFCIDLGSRTGISWESGPKRSGWLDRDHAVRLGPYGIRFLGCSSGKEEPATGSVRAAESRPALPGVSLEFLNGTAKQPRFWRLTPALALIGKAAECKVRLLASGVSRYHASLVRTPQGVWVVDLLGQGSIAVNNSAVRCTLLEDGDQLEIGKFLIRVHYDKLPASGLRTAAPSESQIVMAEPHAPQPPVSSLPSSLTPVVPGFTPSMPAAALTINSEALLLGTGQLVPKAELVEALLVPLANQFNLMQQQMFDQFQQTMMMMVQMFSNLHREQLGLVRQELDRLNQLTAELQTLKAELVQHALAGTERATAGLASTSPAAAGVPPSILSPVAPAAERTENPVNGTPSPLTAPPAATVPPATGSRSERDIHAWLHQRIAAIQQERHTRWQKILNFLTGR
jgi:pSer/pThr/pTyr-binding forkhead associated (FHA) protein